jgi:hypothetical protein
VRAQVAQQDPLQRVLEQANARVGKDQPLDGVSECSVLIGGQSPQRWKRKVEDRQTCLGGTSSQGA